LDNDPFGLGGGSAQPLTDMELEAIAPFAATVRDQAVTIINTSFSKEAEVTNVAVNTVTGADVETALVGDYFLVEVNVQSQRGELYQCMTFLHRDETSAAFDLGLPTDPADWSAQIDGLQNPVELICEGLNEHVGVEAGGELTLLRPKVTTINMPEEYPNLLIAADEQLVELMYQLDVTDVGQLQVTSLVPVDLVRRLASRENEGAMDRDNDQGMPVGAGGMADDPLLGLGGDSFQIPTGRTGADILESIPPLTESQMSGFGMPGASQGYGTPAPRGGDGNQVRPAQFPSFGESPSREAPSNIDLILDVNLRITVELGRTSKSIREVLDLGPGAVIELDKLAGEPVDILVNDKPIAKGEVVVVDENFGVRVTDIISPAGRVATLR
jgi:flagellar motor switch protein FliN/FliY